MSIRKNKIKNAFNLILGLLITAASFNLFFLPNNLVVYDSSGLSIVVEHFFNISPSLFVFIFLVICLFIGFIFLGFKDTKCAILGSIAYPIFIKLTENIEEFITFDKPDLLVIAIFAGITTGFGNGLIFKSGYNTGGTDIIELILCKYMKIPFSKAMIIIDGAIVLIGAIVFGYDLLIYALIILVLIAIISDNVLLGIHDKKAFYIITDRKSLVERFLIEGLKKGVTILNTKGAYTNQEEELLYCIVYTKDYYRVKEGITAIDPNAFIIITDTHEVLGSKKI